MSIREMNKVKYQKRARYAHRHAIKAMDEGYPDHARQCQKNAAYYAAQAMEMS